MPFCVRIAVQCRVRFPEQGDLQFSLDQVFPEMCALEPSEQLKTSVQCT
jgi:hypothetical protein